jgi:Flp pilus assembly protein TadG
MNLKTKAKSHSFARAESGSTSIIFGLSAVPMMLMAAAGFDYNLASNYRGNLQQATDAVALASAKEAAAGVTGSALQAFAAKYLEASTQASAATLTGYPSVNSTTGEVCVKTQMDVDLAFMRIVGITTLNVQASSCAQVAAGTFEIALVLDTTGSMGNADNGGQSKLTSMKNAANTFIDTMFDSAALGPRTKMSVVPFAPSVNVGTGYATANWMDTAAESSWHWKSPMFTPNSAVASSRFGLFNVLSAQRSSWAWGGCVESLPYPHNVSDAAPSLSNKDTYFVPMLAPDEPANVTRTEQYYSGGRWRTRTVTDASYNNSYIGDKGACSTSAPTDNSTASQTTAQSRLCKYQSSTDRSSTNGPNAYCTSKPLVRLQTAKTTLKNTVTSLTASGTTNIHEGFMWGWRTISPNAPFADGVAYNTNSNTKVIVLMTDGQNTWFDAANALNGSDYSAYGYYKSANGRLPTTHQNVATETQARAAMDELVRQACSAARAKGITIYTIAFSVNSDPMDEQAKQLLRDCAGDTARYYAPNSQSTLSQAFASIGNSISKLRVTQ